MKRVLAIAILLLSIPVSAGALTWHGHAAYVLRNHHARCATNYHRETIRVKGKRVVGCVYERPVTTVDNPVPLPTTTTTSTTTPAPPQTPVVSLSAHIDPTFTQSPSNPLAVTYAASASATVTTNGVPAPDPSLPSGVLDLFSDGSLECSTNVGGSVSSANCPVTYSAFGKKVITTEYISGTLTGTDTETDTILPYAPTITLADEGCNDSSSYCEIVLPVTITNLIAGQPNGTIAVITTTGPTPITAQCPNLSAFSGTTATATCLITLPKACQAATWSGTLVFSGDSVYPNASATTDSYSVLAEPSLCPPPIG